MKRVAIYVRVSTQEQKKHGLSVDNQIDSLTKYCKENGYIIQGIYNDAGISARKTYKKRPALLQLIEACQNREVDLMIFTRLDRFFRSVKDYYSCVEQMNGVPWRAIWEDYETETSSGMFKVNIMLSIAQAEADRTSEKIKSVKQFQKDRGDYVGGRAPTGYRVEKCKLYKDEATQDAINDLFNEYLNTFSISAATRKLHMHGINMPRASVKTLLMNPAYCGDAQGHKCEPYISTEQYEMIQRSFQSGKASCASEDFVYLYSGGLFRCSECNHAMVGTASSWTYKGVKTRYKNYVCANHVNLTCNNSKKISERKLEKALLDSMEQVIGDYNMRILDVKENNVIDIEKSIVALEHRLERVGNRYEDGDITREEYRAKRDEIHLKIDELKKIEVAKPKEKLPDGWQEIYQSLDDVHKRAFWYENIKLILIHPDGSLDIKI